MKTRIRVLHYDLMNQNKYQPDSPIIVTSPWKSRKMLWKSRNMLKTKDLSLLLLKTTYTE